MSKDVHLYPMYTYYLITFQSNCTIIKIEVSIKIIIILIETYILIYKQLKWNVIK
jgi:hypothetical protein